MIKPLKIGHKGASLVAPENTLLAFQKAIDLKADYVEFDLHLTRDNEIVICHDADTLRTTGIKKVIKETTLGELQRLDAGEGEKIPTLKELIKLSKGKLNLQPEIKAQGMAELIVDMLKRNNLIDTVIISSFDFSELLKVKALDSRIKIGYLIPSEVTKINLFKRYIRKALKNDFYAIHPYYNSLTPEIAYEAHVNGLKINVWTVDEEKVIRKLVDLDVDGIITDDLNLLNKIIEDLF
jgi:glycerophosphoryl diester phosphodiesterase